MVEQDKLTPQEKTTLFLNQDVRTLEVIMQGIEIAVAEAPDRRIRVGRTKPYLISENDGMYRRGVDGVNIDNLPTGTFWALYWPLRKMCLSLLTAREGDRKGACVQLLSASSYNPS